MFESTLKPAVFALFFVICLEPSVKAFTKLFLCAPCYSRGCLPTPTEEENPYLTFCARLVAVVVVLALVSTMVWLFLLACLQEAEHLQTDAGIYATGVKELYMSTLNALNRTADDLPNEMAEGFRKKITQLDKTAATISPWMHTLEDEFGNVVNNIVSSFGTLSTQVILCFLYVLFALCQPPKEELPGQIEAIVRRFIFLKTLTNALFAVLVVVLLSLVHVDLAGLFGILSWFLNFIPEIGPFISVALPMPLVMLDSRMPLEERLRVALIVLLGQLVIKFIVSNILETYLFGHDARFGEVHPVVVMLFAMLCGEIWGAFGMLVSVPLLALLKLLLDDEMRDKIHDGDHTRARAASETLAHVLRLQTKRKKYSIVASRPGTRPTRPTSIV